MTVVMALVAILFTVGAFAFLSARNQYLVDGEAEKLLSTIREAQNKSFAVNADKAENDTKVWSVGFYPNTETYQLESFYMPTPTSTSLTSLNPAERVVNLSEMGIDLEATVLETNIEPHVSFASPFASPYLTIGNQTGAGACRWATSAGRPAKDFFISATGCSGEVASPTINPEDSLIITLTYKDQTKTIVVKTNGDASIE